MVDPFKIPGIRPESIQLDPKQLQTARPTSEPTTKSFKDVLSEAVGEVQRLQTEADNTIKQLVAGEITDVTEAMVAVEKADISFQTMMAVRSKIVSAYEEVMRMQV